MWTWNLEYQASTWENPPSLLRKKNNSTHLGTQKGVTWKNLGHTFFRDCERLSPLDGFCFSGPDLSLINCSHIQ